MATNNSREERRRKIVDRGSDRLALITGKIQSLPPPPPLPSPSSTAPYRLLHTQSTPPPSFLSHGFAAGVVDNVKDDDEPGATILSNHKITEELSKKADHTNTTRQVKPQLRKYNTISAEAVQTLHAQSSSLLVQKEPNVTAEPVVLVQPRRPAGLKFFTSKGLNTCIIATENTRIYCALVIGFLVVLSYIDYPLFGMNIVRSESVVASRPLYILLLTDMTIVLARLFYLETQRGLVEAEEETKVAQARAQAQAQDDGENWEGAVKVLERGLVVYQAVRGFFIDCSVYIVVVVCGVSLV
ncbi:hypothetical protein FNV43_RR06858 [Rhamnella rubrinervis]|uniref:Uncharacterized protein n=1 Tax=Rhamnella rubrinervis TaxID=2594499 RepID=A0A8K0MLT8_9ROSA|nr:hypothetical protein FNV43_RR06858 [Rhamnella rubrinervis]